MSVQEAPSLCDRLAAAAAGRELAALLADLDLGSLTGPEAGGVLVAQRRQAAHYTAASFDTMVELGLRDEDALREETSLSAENALPFECGGAGARREFPGEFAAEEPRALLHLTKSAADAEFWTGWALHDEFPTVMGEFRAGVLDWPRARLFPEVLLNLTPAQIGVVTARVLPDAPGLTTGQLRARLQREAMAIDPTWRRRRYADQVGNRHVEKRINADGTADLTGRDLPLDEVCQSMANLTRLAKTARRAGDLRPLGVIRADLYTGYLTGSYQQVTDDDIITDLLRRATLDNDRDPARDGRDPAERDLDPAGGGRDSAERDLDPARGGRDPAERDPEPAERGLDPAWGDSDSARGVPDPTMDFVGGAGLVGEGDVAPDVRPDPSDAGPDDPEPRRGRMPLPRRPMPGVRPAAGLEIRVELSTLLGWDEHPGEIAGAGPVAADEARRIVARQTRGRWRYALCDADGYLVDAGVIRARPAGWLDFASPITGATVEIALTEKLLREVPDTLPGRRATTATADSVSGPRNGVGAWAPVLAAITRAAPPVPAPAPVPVPVPVPGTAPMPASGIVPGTAPMPASGIAPGAAPAPRTASAPRAAPVAGGASVVEIVGVGGRGDDRSRRLPRAGLRRRVEMRHRNCVAPACRKPAAECEIDHREEWARGGATLERNLQPLCEWHHRMKHLARWKLTEVDGHTFRWTTPNGIQVDVTPPPVIPDLPSPVPG